MHINFKKIKSIFLFIFLAELISFFTYLVPEFRNLSFIIITSLALILSIKDLKYGIWLLLVELFIGSKGYLFFFAYEGISISIRLALFLIVMSVWAGKLIVSPKLIKPAFSKKQNAFLYYFIILLFFVAWGLVNGFLNNHDFNNIFFDFNGWLYFALLFPLADFLKEKISRAMLYHVFTASAIWLIIKTLILLFIFSHNIQGLVYELYRWTRDSGIGEITLIQGGFYRIFFQSHIFILLAFFIFLFILVKEIDKKNLQQILKRCNIISLFTVYCLLFTVIIISFSRSFWVGTIAGILFTLGIIFYKYNFKEAAITLGFIILTSIISLGLVVAIVKFPFPNPLGGFNTGELIAKRVTTANEAAISSRWQLLPPLLEEIRKDRIRGQGFGAVVTYKSSDPRIMETTTDGFYTTYAFEWGWLDIFLKIGILGVTAYFLLLKMLIYTGLKSSFYLNWGLVTGILVIFVVNIFTPYLNHPLGIGFLILSALLINKT